MGNDSPLAPYLKRICWRLRLRDGLVAAQQTLWAALLAALFGQVLKRLFPIDLGAWAWAPIGLWLAGNILFALARPISLMRTARQVDRELCLKERLSSSLAFDADQNSPAFATFSPALVQQAHQDALHFAALIQPRRDFPIRFRRKPLSIAGGLLVAALALSFLANPMDAIIAQRKAVAEAARQQAAEIEKTRQEIANSAEMSPEERDELLRKLAELAEKLRANPGDQEQALADLSRLEEELRQRLDPKGDQRRAALDALSAQLQALAKNENPQIGDLQAAAEAAQQLAEQIESMSDEERAALAQQLTQMASRAAQASDGALAQALSSLAQAAQTGDLQGARNAAQQAAQALQSAQASLANQQALNRAIAQLQNSRQGLSHAGWPGTQAQQGQGQGPGQGPGNQVGGGGGTNANSLPPATRTGKAGQPSGPGRDTGVGTLDSQVYVPLEKIQGSTTDELYIPGQDSGQGEMQSSEKPDPSSGLYNPALVTYHAVYQQYLDAANQAIDQSAIPLSLKDYIREYFSQLEP